MAEVSKKPSGLPSSNDLDKFKAEPPPQAEIRLGANALMNMAHPPQIGQTRDVVIRLRCTMTGHERRSDDDSVPPTPFCRTRIIAAWELGKPKPADDQLTIDDDVTDDEDGDDAGDGPDY